MTVLYTPTPMARGPSNTTPLCSQVFLYNGYQGHPYTPNAGLPQASFLGLTCRQEDAPHAALAETKLLKNVVKMGNSKEEWAGEHSRAQARAWC